MSPFQASRTYGVPYKTIYTSARKMGILKKYTKDDILAVIEEVKSGKSKIIIFSHITKQLSGMSPLQASRKYRVPYISIYKNVRKTGILKANYAKDDILGAIEEVKSGKKILILSFL